MTPHIPFTSDGWKQRSIKGKKAIERKYGGVLERKALNDAKTIAAYNFDIEINARDILD